MAGNFGWGFIFQRIKSWTGRARSVHHGPTATQTEGAGAWRRAHRSSVSGRYSAPKLTGWGVIERGEHGSSARASPELGRRRSVRGRLERGEKRREAGRGAALGGREAVAARSSSGGWRWRMELAAGARLTER
jgi:hypothetical protein